MKTDRIVELFVIACMVAIQAGAQTAAELLQKGIYTQETAGDLDGAIAIYHQIVNSGNSPRDVAAQAQYRLAQSLLQKGDLANGATEFSNLARNYADYGKLVASLAAQAQANVLSAQSGVQERRLADLIKFEQSRLQALDASRGDKGNPQPDKALLDQALNSIDRGAYDAARLNLNTLINTYATSDYVRRAKLAIADSWLREGGTHGLAQAEAEINDFERFYSRTAPPPRADVERDRQIQAELLRLEALALQQALSGSGGGRKGLTPEQEARFAAQLNVELAALNGGGTGFSLTRMAFDANSPVTIKGVIFKVDMLNPAGAISVYQKDNNTKRYAFLTAGAAETARQGLNRTPRVGDEVTVAGVLASGGQTMPDGRLAARADTITASDGRKLFDRSLIKEAPPK